jgi:uncharacterized protein YkwD
MRFFLLLVLASAALGADARLLQMEKQMHGMVNADRAANGLPALAWDEQLAEVARGHSLEMATKGFFSHDSPTTGKPQDRVFAAGIPASATAENIAMDFDVGTAEQMLMKSPGHRANILGKGYDRLGVGIVQGPTHLYFTQLFRKALKVVDPAQETMALLDAMNRVRKENGLAEVVPFRPLMDIARDTARAMNEEQKLLPQMPGDLIDQRKVAFRAFWSFTGLDRTINPPLKMKELRDPRVNRVGVALVQNKTQEKGLGMLWIVVVLTSIP